MWRWRVLICRNWECESGSCNCMLSDWLSVIKLMGLCGLMNDLLLYLCFCLYCFVWVIVGCLWLCFWVNLCICICILDCGYDFVVFIVLWMCVVRLWGMGFKIVLKFFGICILDFILLIKFVWVLVFFLFFLFWCGF